MAKTHWKTWTNPDYLGAYSLTPGQDKVLTIKDVRHEEVTGPDGKKEKCIVLHFKENEKPMICNKTNAKTITKIYGSAFIEDWAGKKIQITATKVKAFGEMVEALRVVAKANPTPPPTLDKVEKCTDCGKDIKPYGKMTAAQVGVYTNRKYGKTVCTDCAAKLKALEEEPDASNKNLTNEILGGNNE